MLSKRIWIYVAVLLITATLGTVAVAEPISGPITANAEKIGQKITLDEVTTDLGNVESKLTPKELLGELIFFDANLSEPKGQACEDCHGKDVGWTGPNEASNVLRGGVYHGANVSRFGNRKPPTIAYSTFAPNFRLDNATTGAFVGGEFWDGRATGEIRGTAAADQATGPFLNPLEMNNPNGDAVVDKVCTSSYVDIFKQVWGSNACDDKKKAFDDIAFSIVAFEASKEVTPFTSKYDAYLDGKVKLTDKEMKGLELFKGKAICDQCHVADLGRHGKHPLFTNFIYGDPGTPRNPQNPFYNETEFNPLGAAYIDPGLAGHIQNEPNLLKYQRTNYGKFKVPTLRNVDKRPNETFVKRYMHNGFFSSLKDVVHFYNTRDVLPVCGFSGSVIGKNCWPLPEVALNANPKVGNLGLTDKEENEIVAFLKTLSDGFTPSPPATAQRYRQTNLVSDIPGLAQITDQNLVNSWGIAHPPTGPWWVADNGKGVSTLYNGTGVPFPIGSPLVVTIPTGGSTPTGIVFNSLPEFNVTPGNPARFVFVTEDGTISAWNSSVDPTNATLKVNNSPGAVYKGATIARNGSADFLYVANFRGGTVDIFDTNFNNVTLAAGAFVDTKIPAGFAPFNVQNINGKIYVTFAKQDAQKHDNLDGAGLGFVDVFNPDGNLLMRLKHGSWMNAPWGIALAPEEFGKFSEHLLVGNFGSGQIAVFDPEEGNFNSLLRGTDGKPITIDGLWGLGFGNGANAGPINTLFFAAGINDEQDGLFGTIATISNKNEKEDQD